MTLPTSDKLYEVIEATWPPARQYALGPWIMREGGGGGGRVSSATSDGPVTAADIRAMETAHRAAGQPPLVMIRDGQEALDAQMQAEGYVIKDPVTLYACPIEALTDQPKSGESYAIWEPIAVQRELWANGGIGPSRLAVMDRAKTPKTAILTRLQQLVAGCAYVGVHDGVAMIHAVEVAPALRRKGAGRAILQAAGHWAAEQGASHMSLVVTRRNTGANGLYASLNMVVVGQYHYRIKEDAND